MKMSPKYILILRSWYPYGWWDPANELDYVLNCTKSEMEKALNGSLSVALDADYDFDVSLSGLVSITNLMFSIYVFAITYWYHSYRHINNTIICICNVL